MDKILYVTTFNRIFYKACAKNLVKSFLKHVEGDLLICYEQDLKDFKPTMPESSRLILENIDDDDFLLRWLDENSDIIPVAYGGKNKKIKFKIGTVDQFRYRSSKWFRKVVALNRALQHYDEYDAVVLLDADTAIKKNMPSSEIIKIFADFDIIYHMGKHRIKQPPKGASGVESGIVGFKGQDGKEFLTRLINKFKDGSFRQYPRWDDGFVMRKVLEDSNDLNSKDLVSHKTPAKNKSQVINIGPFAEYVQHKKGSTKTLVQKGKT